MVREFDKRIFDCTDQYSLDNLKFSNGYPIVNRSTWTSVWKNLAYVVEQPKWREMIIDLRRLQLELKNEPLKNEQLNKEQLKRAENIFNYFMKTAKNSDYWIRFELIESNNHSSFLNDRGLARAALFTKSFGSVIKFAPGCDIVATIFSEYIFPTLDALKEGASQLKEEKVSKKDHSNLLMKLGYEKRFH